MKAWWKEWYGETRISAKHNFARELFHVKKSEALSFTGFICMHACDVTELYFMRLDWILYMYENKHKPEHGS
jgi:hypothetical protein